MDKSPDAFRTISEVAELLDTPAHVLRFWESRFPQIKPVKRAGGRRYYRPADMALLSGIRKLLHDEGMTIRGVQKILREQGVRHVSGMADDLISDEIDLHVVDEDEAEAAVISSAPIPLFPTTKVSEPAAREAAPEITSDDEAEAQDAPAVAASGTQAAPERAAGADGVDEAALLAAISGPADEAWKAAQAEAHVPAPHHDAPEEDAPVQECVQDSVQDPVQDPVEDSAQDVAAKAAQDAPELPFEAQPNAEDAEPSGIMAAESSSDPAQGEAVAEPTFAREEAAAPETVQAAPPQEADEAQGPSKDIARNSAASSADKTVHALPGPMPPILEISGHWLAADLRTLRPGAFGKNRAQVEAIFARLEVLRNRVGDLGRVPRR